MLTVVPVEVTRRPVAGPRRLLAVTGAPLAVPRRHFNVNVVPHNSRSVRRHGTMVS